MPDNHNRHAFKQLKAAVLARSNYSLERERDALTFQRERDREFVRLVALAIWRGDHIPKGQPKPVRPLVLCG